MPPGPNREIDADTRSLPEKWAEPAWAWAPYIPTRDRPWTLRQAGHLFRRAAFGAGWDQLQQALATGPQPAIDALLHPAGDLAAFNRAHDDYDNSATGSADTQGLRAWWLRRIIDTPHPLLEKMTLFWHDYFAISNARVNSALLICRHLQQLRRHALGSFAAMLEAVLGEPAVYICLNAQANRQARPNPFFARTILERFTLGPDHFSEQDIEGMARAFTGWFVMRNELRYIPREHDPGQKRFLGQEGPLTSRDVLAMALHQPHTPQRVVRRLYRWLISETSSPPETLLAPLAEAFATDYNISNLVETMLRSNLFFSPAAYRQKIKAPVDFALGIIRGLNARVGTTRLGADLAALGQDLFHPPTPRGWAGHEYWINRFTLLGRTRLAQALFTDGDAYGGRLDPVALVHQNGHTTLPSGIGFLLELFLQGDVPEDVQPALLKTVSEPPYSGQDAFPEQLRTAAALVAALPEFHLA